MRQPHPLLWETRSTYSRIPGLTPQVAQRVNTLETQLRASGVWEKLLGVWPFAGTTSSSQLTALKGFDLLFAAGSRTTDLFTEAGYSPVGSSGLVTPNSLAVRSVCISGPNLLSPARSIYVNDASHGGMFTPWAGDGFTYVDMPTETQRFFVETIPSRFYSSSSSATVGSNLVKDFVNTGPLGATVPSVVPGIVTIGYTAPPSFTINFACVGDTLTVADQLAINQAVRAYRPQ